MNTDTTSSTTGGDHTQPGDAIIRLALRPKEAAAAIGISERKLWSITADQTSGIPHARFGKTLVYPIDELRRWLAERARK